MMLSKYKLGTLILLVVALVLASFTWLRTAQASPQNDRPQVMMVLDASRSMWGRVDGRPKVAIAREVIQNLMSEWNPDIDLGLMAYGHRKSGDCEDIELMVPVGPNTASEVNRLVQSIIPEGRTPLSQSLIEAANALNYRTQNANLVLVTDGLETCGKNPCEVARKLQKQGVNFTAHVIGYDLNDAESRQLSCIADSTGGLHLKASSAEQLKDAFNQIVKKVEEPKRTDNDSAIATLVAGSSMLPDRTVKWTLGDVSNPQLVVMSNTGNPIKLDAQPGDYILTAAIGNVKKSRRITIHKSDVKQHRVALGASALVTMGLTSAGDGRILWEIFQGNTRVGSGVGKKSRTILTPGKYSVRGRYQGADLKQAVTLVVGQQMELEFDFRQSKLGLQVLAGVGQPAIKAHWAVYKVNADGSRGAQVQSKRNTLSPTLSLPAGTYIVEATHPEYGIKTSKSIYLAPNKAVSETLAFKTGNLQARAVDQVGGKPLKVKWLVYEVDINGKRGRLVTSQISANPNFNLPEGQYYIVAQYGDQEVEKKVTIRAGQGQGITEEFIFNGALNVSAAEIHDGIDKAVVTHWSIYANNKLATSRRDTASTSFKLKAGEYKVVAEHGVLGIRQEAMTTVTAGSPATLRVVYPTGAISLVARDTNDGPAKEVDWLVYELLPNGKRGKLIKRTRGAQPSFSLAEGRYQVVARDGNAEVQRNITISKGRVSNQEFILNGTLHLVANEIRNGDRVPVATHWSIYAIKNGNSDDHVRSRRNKTKTRIKLTAGKYKVVAEHAELGVRQQRTVTIKAGESTHSSLVYSTGTVSFTARDSANGPAKKVEWLVYEILPNGKLGKLVKRTRSKHPNFSLAEGKYRVIARDGDAEVSRDITIRKGKVSKATFLLTGELVVLARESKHGKPAFVDWKIYQVFESGETGEQIIESNRSKRTFKLPAGRYRVIAIDDEYGEFKRTIRVHAGKTTRRVFSFDLGTLSVRALDVEGGTEQFVKWEVFQLDQNGRLGEQVIESNRSERNFKLPAGKYQVTAMDGDAVLKKTIQVHAGKATEQLFYLGGTLNVSAWQIRGGKKVSVQWLVYRMDKGDEPNEIAVTGIRAARSFVLPAGRYRVVGRHDAMDREADIEIKPGQVINRKFFLNLGTLSLSAYRKGDDLPVAVKWHVYRLDEHGMSIKEVATSIRAERDVILPAGKYRVLARHDKQSFSEVVEVNAGHVKQQKFVFPSDTNRNSKLNNLKPLNTSLKTDTRVSIP